MDYHKLTWVKVNLNYLGQIMESAGVRADMLEQEAAEQEVDDATESYKTVAFIREAIEHVTTALEQHDSQPTLQSKLPE